ncbi:histidine phosphatase family protein [Sphingomonas sp. Mn802worker]|uniref:histidine phosphatase family protein n=1 Tax=Sphingomonas sp. Mn802worker TaxID=629773 RepID=UPI00037121F0|nr:histidine phosphatase family protein [Sphingomonas sp. Mn802worker]
MTSAAATRLTLLCAGATRGLREGRFPDPAEPLDDGGRAKVRAAARDWSGFDRCFVSPAASAIGTAALLGIKAAREPALRDADAGDWAGRGMDEIGEAAFARWLAAPEQGAPGGESMATVRARVGAWLDALDAGRVLVMTHAAVIRAGLAHALAVPDSSVLAIDVAPLTRVILSRHGRWRLQALVPPREG